MTVLTWIDALPQQVVQSFPRLSLLYGWARFTTGQWEAVGPVLQDVERTLREIPDAPDSKSMLGEVAAIRSGVAYETGDMERTIELCRQALTLLPEDNLTLRGVVTFNLGLGSFFLGDLLASGQAYSEAVEISRAAGNATIELIATGGRIQIEVVQGHLRKAAEIFQQSRDSVGKERGPRPATCGLACVQMGEVLRQWNDLETAERNLLDGIELCRQQGGMPEVVLEGIITLSRVLRAGGDDPGALEALRQAEALLVEFESRSGNVQSILAAALAYRVRLWLVRGDMAAVAQWVREQGFRLDDDLTSSSIIGRVLQARVLIAQGNFEAAGALLERLRKKPRLKTKPGL